MVYIKDRLLETAKNISSLNQGFLVRAQKRLDSLTKPKGSLGRLEEIAARIVAIFENPNPSLKRKVLFVFAADHGVAREGVSAYPQEVTSQMVYNFLEGGAAINVLARHVGAEVVVIDAGVAEDINPGNVKKSARFKQKKVGYGTSNMLEKRAMTRKEALRSIQVGIEAFEEEHTKSPIDIVGVGEMGIANTTASSAVLAAITGKKPEEVTGKGTGINDEIWQKKVEVIKKALEIHHPDIDDPLDILSKVGGYEIGAIAGCILAAASSRVPIVIDGFISTVSAILACKISPPAREFIFASHLSQEKGHRCALEYLNLTPFLCLNMRLGEGTGAALAMFIIEAAIKLMMEMETFEEAKVSKEILLHKGK
ncbi:nicotinate-nucleotide--dimethylbenzimidazole phosphoribosyltransferase [Candidatus Aerophobetes bacterium]|nr:nicotinate-nucleotide--dimethylbenzimidazole phosphoribosyltransferase [Candidatus Aerophobetes bacterium]